MGGANSKTEVDSITNQLLSVISTTTAKSAASYSGANVMDFSGSCQVKGTVIKQSNYLHVTTDVLQNVTSSSNVTQELQQKIKQISEAEAVNLSLSGGADSETLTKLITNLSMQIQQNVSTGCAQTSTQVNAINCSQNASLIDSYIEQEMLGEYLFKCTQNITSVVSAQQDLQTFIDQHSTAKVQDIIVQILIMVAILACIILFGPELATSMGSMTGSGGSGSSDTIIYGVICVMVLCLASQISDCAYFELMCKGSTAKMMYACIGFTAILILLSTGYVCFKDKGSDSGSSVEMTKLAKD